MGQGCYGLGMNLRDTIQQAIAHKLSTMALEEVILFLQDQNTPRVLVDGPPAAGPVTIVKRGPGRPKGSKTKTATARPAPRMPRSQLVPVSEAIDGVLDALRSRPNGLGLDGLHKLTGYDKASIVRAVQKAVPLGLIQKKGDRRLMTYHVAPMASYASEAPTQPPPPTPTEDEIDGPMARLPRIGVPGSVFRRTV